MFRALDSPHEVIVFPAELLDKKNYGGLSMKAIHLYGYCFYSLERHEDHHGTYVVFPFSSMTDVFQCSRSSVATALTQLEKEKLIRRKKVTFAGNSRIYISWSDVPNEVTKK